MNKPNTNEKTLAARAIKKLMQADQLITDLNLYLVCREVDEIYQYKAQQARVSIEFTIEQLLPIANERSNNFPPPFDNTNNVNTMSP